MCWRATSKIDSFCNQTLRATLDTQFTVGPYRRMTVDRSTWNTRIQLDQWPVLQITNVQYSAEATFPRVWTTIQNTMYDLETEPLLQNGTPSSAGNGPNSMTMVGGYVTWGWGRRAFRVQVQYLNGWPHAGLTNASSLTVGSTTIPVDDVTGFGIAGTTNPANGFVWPSITAYIYDGAAMEVVSVTGVTATNGSTGAQANGPGSLTIASPGTINAHSAVAYGLPQCMISTMPPIVQQAAINLCIGEALIRGATATAIPNQPGAHADGIGGKDALELTAYESLIPFKRVL